MFDNLDLLIAMFVFQFYGNIFIKVTGCLFGYTYLFAYLISKIIFHVKNIYKFIKTKRVQGMQTFSNLFGITAQLLSNLKSVLPFFTYSNARDVTMRNVRSAASSTLLCGKIVRDKQTVKITYFHNGNKYTIVTPNNRHPRNIYRVFARDTISNTSTDVTETIEEYLGPNYDFHGIPTTPQMLGYPQLEIEYTNGTTEGVPGCVYIRV